MSLIQDNIIQNKWGQCVFLGFGSGATEVWHSITECLSPCILSLLCSQKMMDDTPFTDRSISEKTRAAVHIGFEFQATWNEQVILLYVLFCAIMSVYNGGVSPS